MFLTLLISMSIFTSCQRIEANTAEEKYLPAQTLNDVSYGKDTAQRMDIYLPAGRKTDSTKAVVLIHGGGWSSGSKAEFTAYIDSFQRRMPGYAVFNINYRLYNGENVFPAQENDVKKALSFISEKAGEYHINKNKIVLLGVSAGGHLALLQAYKYKDPAIAAVIDFFGPADLMSMYQKPWHPYVTFALQMVTGTSPAANAALYKASSPVNFITTEAAPTLIFHGGQDQVVNISQSRELKNKLDQAGVKNELVVYPSQKHGWYGPTLSNSFDRIEKFLAENVK